MDHHVIAAFLVPILIAAREAWRESRQKRPDDLWMVVTPVSPLLLTHDRSDGESAGGGRSS